MSSPAERLETAFVDIETEIQKLNNHMRSLDGRLPSQRQPLEAEIESSLGALETRLNKLDSETRNVPVKDRDFFKGEISNFRQQCNQIANELRNKRQAAANNPNLRQGEQALRNQKRSQDVTENLDEAIRIGNDTITTGNVTMTTLLEDKQRLDHISENLDIIDGESGTGLARARAMAKRACFNGCIAWVIVVLLLALMGAEIWYKATRKKDSS
jgi:flagellar biosynthesis GTPase FlhF